MNIPGFKSKSVIKIMKSVKNSLLVPYPRVLFALGIRFVGETTAKLLAKSFPSIELLASAKVQDLLDVEGVGDVIAESIIRYFADERNIHLISELKANGLQFALSEETLTERTDKLSGKSIVISGVFSKHSRDEYKNMIEIHGGKNIGSISSKTSFILAGENMGPAKLDKAQKLGIPIVNEDDFLSMIE
jgi:DNA ligase (NAD+)